MPSAYARFSLRGSEMAEALAALLWFLGMLMMAWDGPFAHDDRYRGRWVVYALWPLVLAAAACARVYDIIREDEETERAVEESEVKDD